MRIGPLLVSPSPASRTHGCATASATRWHTRGPYRPESPANAILMCSISISKGTATDDNNDADSLYLHSRPDTNCSSTICHQHSQLPTPAAPPIPPHALHIRIIPRPIALRERHAGTDVQLLDRRGDVAEALVLREARHRMARARRLEHCPACHSTRHRGALERRGGMFKLLLAVYSRSNGRMDTED